MRRLLSALLLRGLWKCKPIHAIVLWVFLAFNAWMGSPYFMYYVVGAPEPGTAPRYLGSLHIEGRLSRTSSGWAPPRYFIRTSTGDVDFHCGYVVSKHECQFFFYYPISFPSEPVIEIGYDSYWGIDYAKFPLELNRLNWTGESKYIKSERKHDLKYHRGAVIRFLSAMIIYLIFIVYILIPTPKHRTRRPEDAPTETEVVEQLRHEDLQKINSN